MEKKAAKNAEPEELTDEQLNALPKNQEEYSAMQKGAVGPPASQILADKAGIQLRPSKESWLHDFMTGAQGKNALATNNWAEGAVLMGIPGVLPAAARALNTAKGALGFGGSEASSGGGSTLGAIARKLAKTAAYLYGGHEMGKLMGGEH